MAQNIKMITTKLPTYLEVLLQEECNIKLVFRERIRLNMQQPTKNEDFLQTIEEISELELTGTPLQTDLGGDDTVSTDVILEKPQSWTAEEAQQCPLTLGEARIYINNQLRLQKGPQSVYCICDGHDEQHIVVMGATVAPNKIGRVLVSALPCYDENHEITTLEYMKKNHIRSVRKDAKIEISHKKNFNLFGYNLQNCRSLQNVEHNGNISVDVSTAENNKVCQNSSYIKMNLQVVVGHNESALMNFWLELCRIQSYIKQLESIKQLNESTVINCENNLDCEEITSIINDLVNTVSSSKKITSETLDLENLRQLNILDRLWNTLKHCKTLSDLRDCFHLFFEELAQEQTKMHVLNEDKSAVGEIVNGILEGRVAVPTLNFSQSLELLIELGLEKLKKDYLVIITSFYSVSKEAILKMWLELGFENSVVNTNKSLQRRTRISINPKAPITDLTSNKIKLTFLDSLHKITEFMFLYKDNLPMSEEGFDSFCETLCNRFIGQFPKVIQSCDFKQLRLCKFSFDVSSADANKFIKDKFPVASTVRLTSSIEYAEVITVFHFSEYPIFPPSIFEDYEIQCDNNDIKNVYVTKLVKYVQHC